jgi:rhamnosyltransferase
MHASVAILTKNPGPIFRSVLETVLRQQTPFPFEIIVVDSGSSDGTVAYVQRHPNVRLIQIDPEEFGHGKTRNLATQLASGSYVAFLTHDAIPADEHWLARLVAAVEQSPDVAGSFGRHVAHRDASPFMKRDLEAHFAGFLRHPAVLSLATDPQRYARDQGWRQLLHFYSDNNSCLRRSAWEKIPYPEVEFAEDQIWAKTIIEAGYSKAYAHDAVVEHSHDYGPVSQLRRAFDEANAFRELFGYRLGANPLSVLASFAALARRDIAFARAEGIGLGATSRQVVRDAALVSGHFLGTHARRLPERLGSYLSHDKRLLRNLRTSASYS